MRDILAVAVMGIGLLAWFLMALCNIKELSTIIAIGSCILAYFIAEE